MTEITRLANPDSRAAENCFCSPAVGLRARIRKNIVSTNSSEEEAFIANSARSLLFAARDKGRLLTQDFLKSSTVEAAGEWVGLGHPS